MEGEIVNITRKKEGDAAFAYIENEILLAEMVYKMTAPTKLAILHIEVDESLKGKNIGQRLQHELVLYARSNNFKVVPYCPFARAMFKKKIEWRDVLA